MYSPMTKGELYNATDWSQYPFVQSDTKQWLHDFEVKQADVGECVQNQQHAIAITPLNATVGRTVFVLHFWLHARIWPWTLIGGHIFDRRGLCAVLWWPLNFIVSLCCSNKRCTVTQVYSSN